VKRQAPTAPAAEIKLRVLTPEQGRASGYKAISIPVSPKIEGAIVTSMEASMIGCDAVWFSQGKGMLALARRASDLWTDS